MKKSFLRHFRRVASICTGILVLAGTILLHAQGGAGNTENTVDPVLYKGMQFRSLGFSRGGRSTAVAGVIGRPLTYYFGSTGGGVWKTDDAGLTWANISDGFFEAGSIGAIAVSKSDPNVVYVGTGSACPRGNISPGLGVYKSTDAGKTWKHAGLRQAGQIGRIHVHPSNPDLVYVAVLGNIFAPGKERGLFRSKDGGRTWENVLSISQRTGAVDLSVDPGNPRVIYAAMWTAERKPWTIVSGSEESGLYKSTDGGDSWKKLAGGLPEGVVGKIAVALSPAQPDRVWALVEAADDKGGVYRSDDAGQSWSRINTERRFLQRAWYYIHIYADPQNPDTVYILNTGFYKSTDGGKSYRAIRVPHGDNHDLWINPEDPRKMINANDGGANVSLNGGSSWSTQMNQPTAEFYRVAVDSRFRYRVYGAQQDNTTASVPSRAGSGETRDFYPVGGGESGHIAVDPGNPAVVWAGSYGGYITRTDTDTGLSRTVRAYPEAATGQRASDLKYRFQWNAPIRISPHDSNVVYHTSQHVHRTRDAGHSWEVISPDLTRNDKSKQDYSGGPISRDNTGVEVFGTIFAFEESPKVKGLLWAGSDDGLVHISRDNGAHWKNITPRGMPEFATVNMIDLSAHDPGRAFIAVHRYRQNDFSPYIFRTGNYGESWDLLTNGKNGIPADHFVRAVREDPDRKGLLYAGTEFGLYVSFDDGAHWQIFQLNLPVTPITDLLVYRKDLLVATQGRAFWSLDDLSPLHQLAPGKPGDQVFVPRDAYRAEGFEASIYYYLTEAPKDGVMLEVLDAKGAVVQSISSKIPTEDRVGEADEAEGPIRQPMRLPAKPGMNRFAWDLSQTPLFKIPPRIVMWGGAGRSGPKVAPGPYQIRLRAGDWSQTQPIRVIPDPRLKTTQAEYQEELDFTTRVGQRIRELYDLLIQLRDVRKQALDIGEKLAKAGYGNDAGKAAQALSEKLRGVEGELTQLQGEGGQDALNFPGRLDNQFVTLYSEVAGAGARPTAGAVARFEEVKPILAKYQAELKKILDADLAGFNQLAKANGAAAVILPAERSSKRQ